MKNTLLTIMLIFANCSMFSPVMAEDQPPCLECHEPAEDWEGMSATEIFQVAMDPDVELHEDNHKLSEAQLQAFIAKLLPVTE